MRTRAQSVALGTFVLGMLGRSQAGADDDTAVRVVAGVGDVVLLVSHLGRETHHHAEGH